MKTLFKSIFLMVFLPAMAMSQTWGTIESVTDDTQFQLMPSIAIDSENHPAIAYQAIVPPKYDILVSTKTGRTWKTENITNTNEISDYHPNIASGPQGELYVGFQGRLPDRRLLLFFHLAGQKNGKWLPPECPTATKESNAQDNEPDVAVDLYGKVHITFHDDAGNVFYISKDGDTWSEMEKVPAIDPINWDPSITTTSDGRVHIVFVSTELPDRRLVYISRSDKGWTEPKIIADFNWKTENPRIETGPDDLLHVVAASGPWDKQNIIYLTGRGDKWIKPIIIDSGEADCDLPELAVDEDGNAHILYQGGLGGNDGDFEIYYRSVFKGRVTSREQLTNDNIFQHHPSIAIDNKGIGHATFYAFDGEDTEIFYVRSRVPLTRPVKSTKIPSYIDYPEMKPRKLPVMNYEMPAEAEAINGKTFYISAGHGGEAHVAYHKIGVTWLREGNMNLRVALYLRDFLKKAGATVYQTRTDDNNIFFSDRPQTANTFNPDMYISIHHNAFDFLRNESSVYYHGYPDFRPTAVDAGRYAVDQLARAINIPNAGAYSDFHSYPGWGYGELRYLHCPGLLFECSYYTNFAEEQMLRSDEYQKREAFAIFTGLCRYYAAPKPSASIIEPEESVTKSDRIKIQIDAGLKGKFVKIIPSTITIKLDDVPIDYDYDVYNGILTLTPFSEMHIKYMKETAAAEVELLKSALENFKKDKGYYPEILDDLITFPDYGSGWKGTYLMHNINDLIDPWGDQYEYTVDNEAGTFEVGSVGLRTDKQPVLSRGTHQIWMNCMNTEKLSMMNNTLEFEVE